MAKEQINLFDGLFSAGYESIYDFQVQTADNRKNLGHDFRTSILSKSLSNALLRNEYIGDFIILLQEVIVKYVDAVTHLNIYKNYTVSKNYTKIR
jgi:hypothetical protein